MNVNPFSYLIEKLKGKVDKHTSFIGTTDIDTVKAQGVYPLSQYNSNLPEIGSNKDWSTLYVSGNENDVVSQIFVSRGNRIFFRHCVSGIWGSWNELALKSDIPQIKTKDFSVTFSNNGDVGFTFPSDCTTPISCHIVGAWGAVSLFDYYGSWGFHSVELANTTQTVRLVYV